MASRLNYCADCGVPRVDGPFCGGCGARFVDSESASDVGVQLATHPHRDDFGGSVPVGPLRAGRDPDNDLVLSDPSASRWHFRVESGSPPRIRDLDTFRGTRVNGERLLGSRDLVDGDVVTVGSQQATWRDGALASTNPSHDRARLTAEHLSVVVKGNQVLLDDVSLTFRPGTLTAVIGPSGAGKSTLLGALTGLRPATSGRVTYLGSDLYEQYDDLKLLLGFVPQKEIQYHQLSVRQALGFSAALRLPPDASREELATRVSQVVETLQLTERMDNRIGSQLSGGQRKRVSIATELLTAPPVLFLDEPTSGLDPGLDIELMGYLRGMADSGRIVVVVTHSVLSLDRCDVVVALAPGGRVAYAGPPRGLLEEFVCSDYAQVFERLERRRAELPLSTPHDLRGSSQATMAAHREELKSSVKRRPLAGIRRDVFVTHLRTLTERNLAVLTSDRILVVMLLAMPIVLGLGCRLVQGGAGLSLLHASPTMAGTLDADQASKRLTILVLSAVLMGTALSIRAVVAERSIFLREYAAGLDPDLYVASKVGVLGFAAGLQGIFVTLVATAFTPGPDFGGDLHLGRIEVMAIVALLSAASAVFGLALSAVLTSTDQAMPVLVAVVMVQLLLSGSIITIAGRPLLQLLSWFVPARWAYAGASSSVSLQRPLREQGAPLDAVGLHGAGHYLFAFGMLLMLTLVAAELAFLAARHVAARRQV